MVERRRPDQKETEVHEEVSRQAKQDPRRERSGPLWVAMLQQLQIEFEALKKRMTDLEAEVARERALRAQSLLVSPDEARRQAVADPAMKPTLQLRAPSLHTPVPGRKK